MILVWNMFKQFQTHVCLRMFLSVGGHVYLKATTQNLLRFLIRTAKPLISGCSWPNGSPFCWSSARKNTFFFNAWHCGETRIFFMKIIKNLATENCLFSHFPTVTAHVHRFFLWSLKHDIFRQKMRFSTSIVFCCKLALRFMHFHCRDFAYNSKSRLWEDKLLGMQLFNADHAASIQ